MISKKLKYFIKNDYFLASLSAFLLIITTHKIHFLIWIFLVPLLIAIYKKKSIESIKIIILFSLISGLGIFWWIIKYKTIVLIGVILLWLLFFLVFGLAVSFLSKKIKYYSATIIGVWMIVVFLFGFLPFENFWLNLAIFNPLSAPIIWIIGSWGITFFIVSLNSLVANYIISGNKVLLALSIIIFIIFFSSFIYSNSYEIKSGNELKIALIQGNFIESWEWRVENIEKELDVYLNLSKKALAHNPNIIIWPEYSIPTNIKKDSPVLEKIQNFSSQNKVHIVFGALKFKNDSSLMYTDSSFLVSPNETLQSYDSIKIFPGNKKDTIPGESLSRYTINNISFATLMCYEETQLDIAKKHKKEGVDFLVVISNNEPMRQKRAKQLAALYSRLIAAENKLYVVRVSNTGETIIINPVGKVIKTLPVSERNILIGNILV